MPLFLRDHVDRRSREGWPAPAPCFGLPDRGASRGAPMHPPDRHAACPRLDRGTGPPIDDLAVNLASSAGRAAPGGEWIEGRQAAGRGAFESASFVLFFARPPEAPRLPPPRRGGPEFRIASGLTAAGR